MKFYPLSILETQEKPEVLAKARRLYERESLNMRLKALRGKYGVKQGEVGSFTQTAVSKLERRKDIKMSTLVDYIRSLGLGLEIIALPRDANAEREVLLKV
jgi:hypothetical protein